MLIIVTILKRSSQDVIVCRAVLLQSSDKGMLGKGRAVSVAIAEGVSEGQEVDHIKPHVHTGSNHLASGTTTGGSTSAVLCLMLRLAFATHMFIPAHFCCTLPCVPASANRCISINHVLGVFVQVLT